MKDTVATLVPFLEKLSRKMEKDSNVLELQHAHNIRLEHLQRHRPKRLHNVHVQVKTKRLQRLVELVII